MENIKKIPLDSEFTHLGKFNDTEYAFKWTLWQDNLVLDNLKKIGENSKYDTYQTISLSYKKIGILIPHLYKAFFILREHKKNKQEADKNA